MRTGTLTTSLGTFVTAALLCLAAGGASAQTNFGTGPGCSAIEGLDATTLQAGDSFSGRIGTTGVSGVNKNGGIADGLDEDAFTDSMEECINDALVGYCTDIDRDDTIYIQVDPGATVGENGNQQEFTVTFLDPAASCGVSECSDQVDNDAGTCDLGNTNACIGGPNAGSACSSDAACADGADYGADPDCDNYSDNDESSSGGGA